MSDPPIIINVDDHEPARYAKTRILAHAGFRVYDARDGSEAMGLAARYKPDLMLLDVHLPDIDGIEVCRRLKASPGGASILILQISASATAAPHATAALNSGADSYLTEPVDPDVLVATVRALLRLRKAEWELEEANQRLTTLNADLQRSNEDLQQFAFVASHDLQEPLRSVISFSRLLERSLPDQLSATQKEYLAYIVDGALRMRNLIDDLLNYSQLGQQVKCFSEVDLNAVLEWSLQNLELPIRETGAVVSAGPLPTVMGDEAQLGHVFQNLIGNSIKYCRPEENPVIRISAEKQAQMWTIQVEDNGIGISPEYRDTVFAPFKRLHGKEIPGSGIGLAACRRIVEAHHGTIWVESVPGEGSKFRFTVPEPAIDGPAN